LRRRIPTKLRAVVPVGQIVLSLGSKDRGAAAARARRISVAFDALTIRIEARMAASEALTPEEVEQILADFRKLVLSEREDWRANQVSPCEMARLKLENPEAFADAHDDDGDQAMNPDDPAEALAEAPDLMLPCYSADDWRTALGARCRHPFGNRRPGGVLSDP